MSDQSEKKPAMSRSEMKRRNVLEGKPMDAPRDDANAESDRDHACDLYLIKGGPALTFPGCFKAGWNARDEEVRNLRHEMRMQVSAVVERDKAREEVGRLKEENEQLLRKLANKHVVVYAENKRLREALAPFAKQFDDMKARNPQADPEVFEDKSMENIRRASLALKEVGHE